VQRHLICLVLALLSAVFCCQPKEQPPLIKTVPTAPAALPHDLYAHDWAGTEWWYYTGHLKDDAGKSYGFEVTFFRFRPDPEMMKTRLGKSMVGYMAHLAVTEEDAARYRNDILGGVEGRLAGAAADRYHVFVGDWSVEGDEKSQRLRAKNREIGVDLTVEPDKGYVFHGAGGVVPKGAGLANYYISNPRMKASGKLFLDGREIPVSGMVWFDREFGYMGSTPVKGWDWFSLQLDDRTEYMIYRVRRDQNGFVPESKACRIDAEGREECIPANECSFDIISRWKSEKTKGVYPATWRVACEKIGLDSLIIPAVPEQEFAEGLPYWEGSCKVIGRPANGVGFVELVGYAEVGPHGKGKGKK